MNKKLIVTILLSVAIIAVIIGVIFMFKNNLARNKIEIIDAKYNCDGFLEKFYEDDEYIYSFPCTMSTSTFVKFSNGNKMLVTQALEEEKVTIKDLLNAGLEVKTTKK